MSDKPKIFVVTRTPKGLDQILSVKPEVAASFYCAVVNVADSPCATFDYQRAGVPSFWFPINEIAHWGYSPFYGTLKVVNEYYKGDKSVLIHCHAGANRSPSVAYAILLSKGYSEEEAEKSLQYPNLSLVFRRNIEQKHIPINIIEFLKKADESNHETTSLHSVLKNLDSDYGAWSENKFNEQWDYSISNNQNKVRLVYKKDEKKYVIQENRPAVPPSNTGPWIDPVYKPKEWHMTPIKDTR